jgi:polyisoprenyl-phosphate glycosyltransferase
VKKISIVVPSYHEEENIKLLYSRLCEAMKGLQYDWECIIVDDHSTDASFDIVRQLSESDSHIKGCRLSRNCGSHTAILCGLHMATGDAAVVLSADLQDPPEIIVDLIAPWEAGGQVIWAVREEREGDSASAEIFSRLYYGIMRKFVGIEDMPSTGADFFLVDRRVIDMLKEFRETNVSLLALLTWMGFKQRKINYVRKARQHGKSGWSLEKKLKLTVDSITAFTYKPIRLMSYIGFGVALAGFGYCLVVVVNFLVGNPVPGWSSLMVVLLLVGGLQMMMMGILGEYVWRSLDEARSRPRFIIEDDTGFDAQGKG